MDNKQTVPELKEKESGIYDEITNESKSDFNLSKCGLENRSMNVMIRIDENTSKLLNALVAMDLAASRSAAAAFLISEGISSDEQKFLKLLESYETFKKAKKIAQFSLYKSFKKEEAKI